MNFEKAPAPNRGSNNNLNNNMEVSIMSAILKDIKSILVCASFISLMILLLLGLVSYAIPADKLPALVNDISEINNLIKDAEKRKESSGYFSFADFTYEGELNPNELVKWQIINSKLDPKGFIWLYWKNPDPSSPIKVIEAEVYINGTLFVYRYFKYGTPYLFYLDIEKNKYVQYEFTEKEKQSCMRCHSNQVEERKRYFKTI